MRMESIILLGAVDEEDSGKGDGKHIVFFRVSATYELSQMSLIACLAANNQSLEL